MSQLAAAATTPWWQMVFFNGIGAAVISGTFAVLIARLTVRWTRAKDEALRRHERSQLAAQNISATLASLTPKIKMAPPGEEIDFRSAYEQMSLELVTLDDPELSERINNFARHLTELASLVMIIRSYDDSFPRDWRKQRHQYTLALVEEERWVFDSLGAHRADKALPALPDLPPLPELNYDIA